MDASDKKYEYDRFGSKGARVGQAVCDFLSTDQPTYTAGDIIDGYSEKFCQEIEKCIETNKGKLTSPFYVFVMAHKESWTQNVVRNWFIARQTAPYALDMIQQYPHHMKTLYMIDAENGHLKICWSLPGIEDCRSIAKNKHSYDPQLVKWIEDAFEGKLEHENYSFA